MAQVDMQRIHDTKYSYKNVKRFIAAYLHILPICMNTAVGLTKTHVDEQKQTD